MVRHVNLNNQSGFTLVEFCVAVVIIMVGLMGLLQAVNMATVHNLGSVLRNEAITLGDDRMVRAKTKVSDAASFAALDSDTATATTSNNDSNVTATVPVSPTLIARGVRSGFANYSVRLTVTSVGTNTKELQTRVTWRYKGNKQSHNISSVVVNPNPN